MSNVDSFRNPAPARLTLGRFPPNIEREEPMGQRNPASYNRALIFVVTMLCCAAPALRAQWLNYRIPGVPRTADGKVNLSAPVPELPDGKPDLSGTWESELGYFQDLARDLKPGEVVMQPWAQNVQADREGKLHNEDLLAECMPP